MQTTERETVRADYAALVREEPLAFRLSPRVYWDAQLFELELERVFEQGWVYVAHTSELPQRGDFRTATIGRQPLIVAHGQDGQLRVLLNACRHRGSTVCRVERGNTRAFRCSYHGWSYSTTGALVGIPQRDGYPPGFGSDIGGAAARPRVAHRPRPDLRQPRRHGREPRLALGAVKRYVDYWADTSPTASWCSTRPTSTPSAATGSSRRRTVATRPPSELPARVGLRDHGNLFLALRPLVQSQA